MSGKGIRNRIRQLRFDNNGITQKELAAMASCTRQTINALEAGKYMPTLALAFRIARALGTTVEEVFLFDGDDNEKLR